MMQETLDPIVEAYIERNPDTGTLYAYVRCPYCGDAHMHGAGSIEGQPSLGNRLSHCLTADVAGYTLVAGPADMPKPQRKSYARRKRDLEAYDRARGKGATVYVGS